MIYYITAFASGLLNSANRMANVRAGRLFGTENGARINYAGAAALSRFLLLLLGNGPLLFARFRGGPIWAVSAGCSRSFCR